MRVFILIVIFSLQFKCFHSFAIYGDEGLSVNTVFEKNTNFLTAHPEQRRIPLVINNGKNFTNAEDKKVNLEISINGAEEMMISNDENFSEATWEPYKESKEGWVLEGEDGVKNIYVKFKDAAGNESRVYSNSIMLDTTPPQQIRLNINRGKLYTNHQKGIVTLFPEAGGAYQMKFSNDSAKLKQTNWEAYQDTRPGWQLTDGDGEKKVYARFRDQAGNISPITSGGIILDRKPPQNSEVIINNGAQFTNDPDREVKLELLADGASHMILKQDSPRWEPYKRHKDWVLSEGDGVKIVAAMFRDRAGNGSRPVYSKIVLDRKPPLGQMIIDNNASFTNHPKKLVDIYVRHKDADSMMVSNFKDFGNGAWEPVKSHKPDWKLKGEDGPKVVFLQLKDKAGNISDLVMDTIFLDREPPRSPFLTINDGKGLTNNENRMVNLNLKAENAYKMRVANGENFNKEWIDYRDTLQNWVLSEADGWKYVHVQFSDSAGNVVTAEDSILLDRQPPRNVEVEIGGGKRFTNASDKSIPVKITAQGASAFKISNQKKLDSLAWQKFSNPISLNWQLEGDDGLKTVAVRLRDEAGNLSRLVLARIYLDRQPPDSGEIIINNDSSYTNHPEGKVHLKIHAREAHEMKLMNGSNSEDTTFNRSSWEPFAETKIWQLREGEGLKIVSVKFRDRAGNVSATYTDSIHLDLTPPTDGDLVINDDSTFTRNQNRLVSISLRARGTDYMALSNRDHFVGVKWFPYREKPIKWQLTEGEGEKVVYGRFKDQAGNQSKTYQDEIILDRVPPKTGKLTTVDGEKFIKDKDREVDLKVEHPENPYEMKIANDGAFSGAGWQPFSQKITGWQLTENDGKKTLYMMFRDKAGNVSDTSKLLLMLDRTPPENPRLIINRGNRVSNNPDRKVEVQLSAKGASQYMLSENRGFNNAYWKQMSRTISYTLSRNDGIKTLYAQFKDKAGNVTRETVMDSITLDRKPPEIKKFTINQGEEYTNNKEKQVTLYIEANEAYQMLISNDNKFEGAKWEKFSNTVENWQLEGEDGKKVVFVKLRDKSNNITETVSDSIILKRKF